MNRTWLPRLAACGMLLASGIIETTSQQAAADDGVPRVASRATARANTSHALQPVLDLASASKQSLKDVKDYEATFLKKEFVGGELVSHRIKLKLREKPFSVYMRFEEPHAGREVIYVEGRNKGNLLAHEAGIKALAGTFELDPRCETAMDGNRYPITLVGLNNLLSQLMNQWQSQTKFDDVEVKYFPSAKLGNIDCKAVQTTIPSPRKGVDFHMTRLYIDKSTNLPVRVEQFGFPAAAGGKAPLLEEYTYLNVKTNVGLTELDFDTKNPSYDY